MCGYMNLESSIKHENGNIKWTELEINIIELVNPKLESSKISYKFMELSLIWETYVNH